ncbi:hypothetical protein KXX44_008053 [Aspergillus fumigatus]|nr:hypothetical protein KXX44_008053 [Aspergillus fumigatus]
MKEKGQICRLERARERKTLVCKEAHSLLAVFLALCYPIAAYINPIIPGFNPGPLIVRVGDDYWLVVSSFEFTPGTPIYHSKDLINWTLHSHALTRLSQLAMFGTPSSLGVWASTIRYHNNRYYISSEGKQGKYDTLEDGVGGNIFPKGFYVWTDDIESDNWSDPVYSDRPGFNADLFWDDDGKVYLGYTKQQFTGGLVRCWTGEIDLDTGRSLTKPQPLVNVTVLWPERSHIDSHQELSYRSTVSPTGPWESNPHNPMMKNPSSSAIRHTGHADLVEDKKGNFGGPCFSVIWGNAYNLTQVATPTVYLQKQVSLSTVWSTSLEFYPDNSSTTEAGVVFWLSEASHQVIGVRQCDDGSGNRCLITRTFTGTNNTHVETSVGIPATGPVRLYIRAEPTQYTLQYSLDEGKTIKNATSFSNSLLAQGISSFTGSFFGLYSTGRGYPSLVPADFAWARTDEI